MIIIFSNGADDEKQMRVTRTNLYSIQAPLSIDAVRCVMGLWLMRHHFDIKQGTGKMDNLVYSILSFVCFAGTCVVFISLISVWM